MSTEEEYNLFKSMEGKCIGEVSLALQEARKVSKQRDMKIDLCKFQLDLLICNNLIGDIRDD